MNILNYLQKQKNAANVSSNVLYHPPSKTVSLKPKTSETLKHYLHSNHETYLKRQKAKDQHKYNLKIYNSIRSI